MSEHEHLSQWLYCLADARSRNRRRGIRPHPSALRRAADLLRQSAPTAARPAPTPDDFRRWWRETGSDDSGPTPEMLLTANAWAEAWAAMRQLAPAAGSDREEREERKELAAWLQFEADNAQELGCATIYDHDRLRWAAGYILSPAPAPVPGWQPIDTAPQDGTEILASDYDALEIISWDAWETGSGWIDRNGQLHLPAWWQPLPDHPPIPQPPEGGEVESDE